MDECAIGEVECHGPARQPQARGEILEPRLWGAKNTSQLSRQLEVGPSLDETFPPLDLAQLGHRVAPPSSRSRTLLAVILVRFCEPRLPGPIDPLRAAVQFGGSIESEAPGPMIFHGVAGIHSTQSTDQRRRTGNREPRGRSADRLPAAARVPLIVLARRPRTARNNLDASAKAAAGSPSCPSRPTKCVFDPSPA